jgi:hypothetical protein
MHQQLFQGRKSYQQDEMMYLDRCDFIEILSIRDTKASHPMLMTPFFEMTLIGPSSPITVVSTYLTLKFLIKA